MNIYIISGATLLWITNEDCIYVIIIGSVVWCMSLMKSFAFASALCQGTSQEGEYLSNVFLYIVLAESWGPPRNSDINGVCLFDFKKITFGSLLYIKMKWYILFVLKFRGLQSRLNVTCHNNDVLLYYVVFGVNYTSQIVGHALQIVGIYYFLRLHTC
jgi:hypothetical protein